MPPKQACSWCWTGIIAGKDPKVGFAIVGENATAAKVHAVGDNVPGGAKLHSVYSDRVLLDRNGHLEYLTLPRQNSAALNANPNPGGGADPEPGL